MNPDYEANIPRVCLVGNYALDRQESMVRFTTMLVDALQSLNCRAEVLVPQPRIGRFARNYRQAGFAKWLGYVDKYILFPAELRKRLRNSPPGSKTVFHVIDHSNAVYVPTLLPAPVLVTCHDLLAVRSALGEDTACRASVMGRLLQNRILRGLDRAPMVACVSQFTHKDLRRLLPHKTASESLVVPNGLNYPYRVRERPTCVAFLKSMTEFNPARPYLLHVGSNLPRKNKATILRAFARLPATLVSYLVLAGPPLTSELKGLAIELGILDRVVVVENPDNEQLEALYNMAFALVFPSLAEGFGWPVIEAQSCGCPVVCSNTTSLPEVAGNGAQLVDPFDVAAIADMVVRLGNPEVRRVWVERALQNAQRFSAKVMAKAYVEIYSRLAAR